MELAPRVPVRTEVEAFALGEANEALARPGRTILGAAVIRGSARQRPRRSVSLPLLSDPGGGYTVRFFKGLAICGGVFSAILFLGVGCSLGGDDDDDDGGEAATGTRERRRGGGPGTRRQPPPGGDRQGHSSLRRE